MANNHLSSFENSDVDSSCIMQRPFHEKITWQSHMALKICTLLSYIFGETCRAEIVFHDTWTTKNIIQNRLKFLDDQGQHKIK